MVSHDQGLLDRAVQAIAHLDRGKLSLTPGGFAEFVRIRAEQAMQQARAAERIEARRAHMQAFVDRFRYQASKARQAQSRLKALERLPAIEMVDEAAPARFDFPEPAAIAPPVLTLDRVAVGYGGAPVLRAISGRIDLDDRIALLGANGNGKSTFAKLLAGRLAPASGALWRHGRLRVGYFAQHQEEELTAGKARSRTWPAPCRARGPRRCAPSSPASVWMRTAPRRRWAASRAGSGRGCCWRWPRARRRTC